MKLIDFNNFLPFIRIREKMNIPKEFKPNFTSSEAILKKMRLQEIKTKGLDISIDELIITENKTLEHKDFPGQKMIVYIRDFIGGYGKNEDEYSNYPKYHISWCRTLNDMQAKKKYERYVVSQRNDGIFLLNKTINGKVIEKDVELPLLICKNCLANLNYKNYNLNKNKVFDSFNVKEFLEEYNTNIHIEPTYTDMSQPLNEYVKDWAQISFNYKKSKNFICQDCGKDCSNDKNRLHVHHVNGIKSDNLPSNLEVVCVSCHSKKPMHGHMLSNPMYWTNS